jgi:hypothetical protein
MSFSYDPATQVGQVRLLCTDIDSSNPIFQDEDLNALLGLEAGVVRFAAAQALEIMAANEVMVQKRIKLLDLETNGPQQSTELRALANRLRKSEEEMAVFAIAEMVQDSFSARDRIWKQFLRLRQ